MKHIITTLSLIEQSKGSNDKKLILKNHMSDELHDFFNLFYKNVNYNISTRSFEKIIEYNKEEHGSYSDVGELMRFNGVPSTINANYHLNHIKDFLEHLEIVRGDTALTLIKEYYATLNSYYQKWVSRIIVKDLKIGISLKVINKVFVECGFEPIEKFMVQLCGKIKNIKEYNKGFPIGVGCKYDGMRSVVEKSGCNVKMTSRQGEDIKFVPELIEYFKKFNTDFIIDGEILCDSFSDMQKRIGRKAENIEPIPSLHFRAYDILELDGQSLVNCRQIVRSHQLRAHFDEDDMLKLEEYYTVETQEELEKIYMTMCDREEEGIVIKLLDKPYELDGRKNWWKVKPVYPCTAKVIGHSYGTGKNKDKISVLYCECKLNDSEVIRSNVGSGLKDIDRDYCTEHKDELIGKFCDISFYEVTKNSKGEFSFRFPSFTKFREDKNDTDNIEWDFK